MALNAAAFLKAMEPANNNNFEQGRTNASNRMLQQAQAVNTQANARALDEQTAASKQKRDILAAAQAKKDQALIAVEPWMHVKTFFTPELKDKKNDGVNALDASIRAADRAITIAEIKAKEAGQPPDQAAPEWRKMKSVIEEARAAQGTENEQVAMSDLRQYFNSARQGVKILEDLKAPGFEQKIFKQGDVVQGANGTTTIATAPIDLGPNHRLVTPAGQEIATGLPQTGSKPNARDKKIADYMATFHKTREEAIKAVDSTVRIDDMGNLISFDPTTEQGKLIDVNTGGESPVINPPEGINIDDLSFDPGEGTGFGASFIGLWNSTIGQFPFVPIGKDAEQAAQKLRVLERDAVLAMASSKRPPLFEQKRITALIPEPMSFVENPEVANYKMTAFIDLMMNQYVDDIRYAKDRSNPKDVRDTSAGRARRIETIVRRAMVPEAAQTMFDSLGKMETDISQIQNMDVNELNSVDPSTLSDAQLDMYIIRLEEQGQSSGQ